MKRLWLLPSNLSRIALTTIRNVEVVSSGNKKKNLKRYFKKENGYERESERYVFA